MNDSKPESSPTPRPPGAFTIAGRLRSVHLAMRGLAMMLASQHNAWIHLAATIVAVILGLLVGLSAIEWCLIVIAIAMVWSAEALNTALEFLCDVASPDFHPLVEKAKDVAAAGVLICSIAAIVVAALVFLPHWV